PTRPAIAPGPPLALLLTVELISRVPVHRRSLAFVRLLATATIAGIAAWVSYWHMAGGAPRAGGRGRRAAGRRRRRLGEHRAGDRTGGPGPAVRDPKLGHRRRARRGRRHAD